MQGPTKTATGKSIVATILLVTTEAVSGTYFPDGTRKALDQVDIVLSAGLAGTLAGLSITSAALSLAFYSSLSELKRRAVRDGDEDAVKTIDTQREGLVDAGESMVNAFYSFVLALILILSLANGLTVPLSSDLLKDIAVTSSSGAPFISGIVFLSEGARRIKSAFRELEAEN